MMLQGRIDLGVVRDGLAPVALGLVNTAQVGVRAPSKHVQCWTVGAGLGKKIQEHQEHVPCIVQVVPLKVGQGEVKRGIDSQAVQDFLGDRLLLVNDVGNV